MSSSALRALGAAVILFTAASSGCHALGPARRPPGSAAETERIVTRNVRNHPRISLVARLGDPSPAVALAVAHDLGSQASTALAALVQARLSARGFVNADSRPQELGFVVRTLVPSPGEAARFVVAASRALLTPVRAHDPALPVVAQHLAALRARSWTGAAEAAVAHCSGELGVTPGSPLIDPATPRGLGKLEQWRQRVATASSAAFAALGRQPVLKAAARALATTPAWPNGAGPEDPWPTRNVTGVDATPHGRRQLSVALRINDASMAIEAARKLGRKDSTLSDRVRALQPAWKLERVVGTTRPRGACLRIDLLGPDGSSSPTMAAVARVIMITEEEASLALRHAASSPWTLDDSVLRPADPREAAAVAAWRALSGRLPPGATRRFVSYASRPSPNRRNDSRALSRAVEQAAATWHRSTIEVRGRVEAGQGQLWALLASPCGTAGESSEGAGLSALSMHALAIAHPQIDGVSIEPWVTPDGIGLLAHAPRSGPNETPDAHARRVASALGRLLVTASLAGDPVARARADLQDQLGQGPRPGFALALKSAAPGHPSWLDPRGTWQSVTSATPSAIEQRRREILRGPLRLAVLADSDSTQINVARKALDRWLRPVRTDLHSCPTTRRPAARHGELTVETSASTEPNGVAYVVVPTAPGTGSVNQARWTAYLMNRPGGWLDQALRTPGLASSAHAEALGGSRAGALMVEVTAVDDQKSDAVAQVRGLLERLAQGAITAGDLQIAARHFQSRQRAESLDPRYRVVELWREQGARLPPPPTLAELRAFQRTSFVPDAEIVVYVKQHE